jgi:geranylgeranyl reductase
VAGQGEARVTRYDCVVVGGGPAGATAADDLAASGRSVLLLDRAGRIKPCGGAIPPRLIRDFAIPDHLIVGRATLARMIGPSDEAVDMPVDPKDGTGFVGMVDRETFDEWLRARAAAGGAARSTGSFDRIEREADGTAVVVYTDERGGPERRVRARCVIGADGARSRVAQTTLSGSEKMPCVFAYHEVIRSPGTEAVALPGEPNALAFDRKRCDVFYQGTLSPDFYAWVFPHGDTTSVGVGSAEKGFPLRDAVRRLRAREGLGGCETVRSEGAPIPLKPLRRWDNGRDVLVTGDAAGVVAPASGEGIYYAMVAGREAATAVNAFLLSGNPKALRGARRAFMREHGRVFQILGIMQYFWYRNDRRRERFVTMCKDRDVQNLIWPAYMNKKLVYARPLAYVRIFFKDLRHLLQTAG